jgi:hypothetical protein
MTTFWLFFVVIMVAAFTGNLFSFITLPKLLPAVDTLEVPNIFPFSISNVVNNPHSFTHFCPMTTEAELTCMRKFCSAFVTDKLSILEEKKLSCSNNNF